MTPVPSFSFGCPSCGQQLSATSELSGLAMECPACQNQLVVPSLTVSQAPPAQSLPNTSQPSLWNPETASLVAFLVCPVLGPIIHRKNWLALGRVDEAQASLSWAWVFGLLMVAWQIGTVFAPRLLAAWPLYILLFAIWYGRLARKQSRLPTRSRLDRPLSPYLGKGQRHSGWT